MLIKEQQLIFTTVISSFKTSFSMSQNYCSLINLLVEATSFMPKFYISDISFLNYKLYYFEDNTLQFSFCHCLQLDQCLMILFFLASFKFCIALWKKEKKKKTYVLFIELCFQFKLHFKAHGGSQVTTMYIIWQFLIPKSNC